MNRKQKIIISVTGIFIVLLILVGLTYAYFLTRIQGNTNSKSISVTTADLKLSYGDGNGIITGEKIQPGTTLDTKTFTVTNEGNSAVDYAVVLEDVSILNATTSLPTEFESNDFVFTLLCTSSDEENNPCTNKITEEEKFSLQNSVLLSNNIKEGITHTYTLKVTYKETGQDQSNDMNKSFTGKINISGIETNPYSGNKDSLAYNIINNAMNVSNNDEVYNGIAKYRLVPLTTPGKNFTKFYGYVKRDDQTEFTSENTLLTANQSYYFTYASDYEVNFETGKFKLINPKTIKYSENNSELVGKYITSLTGSETNTVETGEVSDLYKISTNTSDVTSSTFKYAYVSKKWLYESTLSVAPDDYGTSYYYRGMVENNYLNFNNMCWRITRIEGDGSIKLILADRTENCSKNMYSKNDNVSYLGEAVFGYETKSGHKFADYENYTGGIKTLFETFLNGGTFNNGTTEYTYNGFSESDKEKISAKKICFGDTTTAYDENGNVLNDEQKQNALANGDLLYKNWYRVDKGEVSYKCDINGLSKNTYKIYLPTYDDARYTGYMLDSYMFKTSGRNFGTIFMTTSVSANDGSSDMILHVHTYDYWNVDTTARTNDVPVIRPMLSLKKDIEIQSGDGTINNPYTLK